MKNCSPNLDDATKIGHINNYILRMQYSGYEKEFRFDVFNSSIQDSNTERRKRRETSASTKRVGKRQKKERENS